MSRPCPSTRGPKPPVAPKPRQASEVSQSIVGNGYITSSDRLELNQDNESDVTQDEADAFRENCTDDDVDLSDKEFTVNYETNHDTSCYNEIEEELQMAVDETVGGRMDEGKVHQATEIQHSASSDLLEVVDESLDSLDCHIVPFFEDFDTESDEHIYEEAGFDSEGENFISLDRKSIVTRSRSLSGKVPGYVPETVPEETGTEYQSHDYYTLALDQNGVPHPKLSDETEANRVIPSLKPRSFLLSPRSLSVEGRDLPFSGHFEGEKSSREECRLQKKDDTLSLPCVITSSGSFSQRSHQSSSGVSTPTSLVDIPPPFELAYITKRPVTKSSPSLLIQHESPDNPQKKKTSFKRFLTLKFKKKSESKAHGNGSVRSSRSSSESSHHGPIRVLELDRRSTSGSPQLQSLVGKPQRNSEIPTTFLLYKERQRRQGAPKSYSNRGIARVESFEDRSRPPFMPLPLTKPRSISFPSADTSDYENIPAINSDYENIQIPHGRPTRAVTITEFFDDHNRTSAPANENDGYVDMNSFAGIENKPTTQEQDPERYSQVFIQLPRGELFLCVRERVVLLIHDEKRARGYDVIIVYQVSRNKESSVKSARHRSISKHILTDTETFCFYPYSFLNSSSFFSSTNQFYFSFSLFYVFLLQSQENLLRLVHIDYSVRGKRDLLQPGRVFVKEGTLMKVSRKSRQPRHLFLMNDVMLYTYPQQDGKYRLKNTLTLSGMKVSKPVIDNVLHTLRIEVSDVTITLSASSLGEREDWFHTLSRAIADHAAGLNTFSCSSEAREKLWMSLGEAAPVLVPVSHVMMCMNCTSDFRLTLRRHHCNACGKVVCRSCSRNRYPLKYLKDRIAKVCDHCYAELRKRGGNIPGSCGSASPRTNRASRPLSAVFQSLQPPSLWRNRKSTSPLTQDKVASESLPLQGFTVKLSDRSEGEDKDNVFQLYHKKTLYYTFRADDQHTARRWVNAMEEATVL
uniref:FYVE, RhoGEF and PH domain containing 5a n=1 Tax=Sinocyclocheilus anshuiensis TaxID=1608454 RepID=A0A671M8P3_9TELE